MARVVRVTTGETKDGTGSGDHDDPFAWGMPTALLRVRQIARLLILRGRIMDARRLSGDKFSDDLDPTLWTQELP